MLPELSSLGNCGVNKPIFLKKLPSLRHSFIAIQNRLRQRNGTKKLSISLQIPENMEVALELSNGQKLEEFGRPG